MTALRRLWLRPAVGAVAWQGLALDALGALGVWVWGNVATNLPRMKLQLGFDFLSARAAFEIGDNLLGYRAGDTILFAFAAGLANTLQVAALGIALTTMLATLVALPPLLAWVAAGEPATVEVPALRGFNFVGGGNVSPEFVALLFALVTYQAGFAAETIRSGILGVPKGQIEAARSLGLSRPRMLRFVVLPQALRIVVPPLTSQYLSLTKNSSIAVAVGYPELVRVSSVVIGDTGRSVECIAIILPVYLSLSLATAALMNRYNARLARDGR